MAFDRITALRGGFMAVLIAGCAFTPAHAELRISAAATRGVTCAAGVCTTTSATANLNAADLTSMLAASDVTLQTDASSQDILVRAAIAWASSHKLTLTAYHSIAVKAAITVQGTSGLTLTTGSGGTLSIPKNVAFWDVASSLTINGNAYTLAGDITTLAGDIAANPSGRFALAGNYDATPDGVYASVAIPTTFSGTFEGLGNTISHFTLIDATSGTPTGLFSTLTAGGTIRDLKVTTASITTSKAHNGVAILLGDNNGGTLENDRVEGRITSRGAGYTEVGGITGFNSGTIDGVYANVILKIGSARPAAAGGVVGSNLYLATISNSQSAGSVSQIGTSRNVAIGGIAGENAGTVSNSQSSASLGQGIYVGGLVGDNGGTITNSSASGNVTGPADHAGGLAGIDALTFSGSGTITGSHASGNVTNTLGTAGGLVGESAGGTISNSYATGNVSGNLSAGGLVGSDSTYNSAGGSIDASYATGTVTAGDSSVVGGLIGSMGSWSLGQPGPTVSRSFATGTVTGGNSARVGGVVGQLTVGSLQDSYAMGAVHGGANSNAGGLVGRNGYDLSNVGTIATSYSTGAVSGGAGAVLGGLIGSQSPGAGSVSSSYWDTDTSGITNPAQGIGNIPSEPGVTAQTSAQLQSGVPSGFSTAIWSQGSGINGSFPYLTANPPH